MKRILTNSKVIEAWQHVKSNARAAGIDRMSVDEFEQRERELMSIIRNKL